MDVYKNPLYDDFTGFTFNGQHSSQFGLLRVSNGDRYEDTLVLSHSDEAADIPGGPGQYYWGETLKPKEFDIKVAYDNVSEIDKRRIKQWLHPDDKLHELIFDERPYVKYWVKCSKEVVASELCFRDGQGGRVYKGEFNLTFIAYMPYGVAVGKTLEDVSRTYNHDSMDTITEWKEASGLLTSKEFEENSIDLFNNNTCKIYNPGDIEAGFKLKFTNTSLRNKLSLKDYSSGAGYELVNEVITESEINDSYIIYEGKYYQLAVSIFPSVTFEKGTGNIITEGQTSKMENLENGQIYDLYISKPKNRIYNYSFSATPDFSETYILYGLDKHNNYYKIYINSIDVNNNNVSIDFIDNIYSDIDIPEELYIARSANVILDIKATNIANTNIKTLEILVPGAAITLPKDWSEMQKAIFYNSEIRIDTNKQIINYQINDSDFNINENEWNGINGAISKGSLFKLPIDEIKTDNWTELSVVPRDNSMLISNLEIDYTYLYK